MKKTSALILSLGALLVASFTVQAQVPTYNYNVVAGSNGITVLAIAASTATNIGMTIDCSKQATVRVQLSSTNTAAGAGAGAGSWYFAYTRSVDGIKYDNALSIAAAPTQNGKSVLNWSTNLDSQGAGSIYIPYITNAMDTGTNIGVLSINQAIKISSP